MCAVMGCFSKACKNGKRSDVGFSTFDIIFSTSDVVFIVSDMVFVPLTGA